ncbi:MAG: glycosyltransferase [Planctomycetes bacterium]|nr:glycosyltransferase [Planctomycetota bacterium]
MLTIGVPTFNRKEVICRFVNHVLTSGLQQYAKILIIDNDSPDGSYERLTELCHGTAIRLLRNSRNIGYCGNFLRLFEECDTEYLLISSDEDDVIKEQLEYLLVYLNKERPLFISPQVFREGHLYRGRNRTKVIEPEDFRNASFYISGLVYNVPASRNALRCFHKHIIKDGVYPQVLLAAALIPSRRCLWFNMPITKIMIEIPMHLESLREGAVYNPDIGRLQGSYADVSARWYQHQLFEDFFRELKGIQKRPIEQSIVTRMLSAHEKILFDMIRFGIKMERSDLIHEFDRGARRFYLLEALLRIKLALPFLSSLPIPGFVRRWAIRG